MNDQNPTSEQLEYAKLEPLKMVSGQSRDYEKWAIELSKSYVWHIIIISALFIGFLPQFIKNLDLKWYFLWVFSVWEIFFVLVIMLILLIYHISIKHQEGNVELANRLYNNIANGNNREWILGKIDEIWQKYEEKNIKSKKTINTLSTILNILFFLWILLVFIPILTSLYK